MRIELVLINDYLINFVHPDRVGVPDRVVTN